MTREEAIKVANEMHGWLQTDREREALEALIPELKESDDERIRKIITDSIFYQYGASDEYNDVLDYLDKLEKQKEPANHTESYMKGFSDGCEAERDACTVSDEKRFVDIQSIEKRAYEVFPDDDDENTPLYREAFINGAVDYIDCGCKRLAKWSDEDEKMRGRAICACNFTIEKLLGSKHYEEARDWLKSLPVGFITNPHYNSDMVSLLVGELQSIAESVETPNLYDAEISWLKSLRSQPAQEWSEEDSALLKEIVLFFKDGTVKLQHDLDLYAVFLENKFKSLRPSWRPSEEHMETLKRFIGPSPTGMILADLYGKLEKLK